MLSAGVAGMNQLLINPITLKLGLTTLLEFYNVLGNAKIWANTIRESPTGFLFKSFMSVDSDIIISDE